MSKDRRSPLSSRISLN